MRMPWLEVYRRPHDPTHPVVCIDEQPKQLLEGVHLPWPIQPGEPEKVDYEYLRHGMCCLWMFLEPLGGWRNVQATAHTTSAGWAQQVRALVDAPRYAQADRITLACDNLNTPRLAALYQTFAPPPPEAMRIARKLELVHPPKHGSWLNMAESELNVLTRQCLPERMHDSNVIALQAQAWAQHRNQAQSGVDWQFCTEDARIKFKYRYPKSLYSPIASSRYETRRFQAAPLPNVERNQAHSGAT